MRAPQSTPSAQRAADEHVAPRTPGNPRIAVLDRVDDAGHVWIVLPGLAAAAASISSHLDPGDVRRAALERGRVLVTEDPTDGRSVVFAFVEERLPSGRAPLGEGRDGEAEPAPLAATVARVDGRRVSIVGHDEVVLQCGPASITLQRHGHVVIRGVRVETDADEVNRIRGASVRIN